MCEWGDISECQFSHIASSFSVVKFERLSYLRGSKGWLSGTFMEDILLVSLYVQMICEGLKWAVKKNWKLPVLKSRSAIIHPDNTLCQLWSFASTEYSSRILFEYYCARIYISSSMLVIYCRFETSTEPLLSLLYNVTFYDTHKQVWRVHYTFKCNWRCFLCDSLFIICRKRNGTLNCSTSLHQFMFYLCAYTAP